MAFAGNTNACDFLIDPQNPCCVVPKNAQFPVLTCQSSTNFMNPDQLIDVPDNQYTKETIASFEDFLNTFNNGHLFI